MVLLVSEARVGGWISLGCKVESAPDLQAVNVSNKTMNTKYVVLFIIGLFTFHGQEGLLKISVLLTFMDMGWGTDWVPGLKEDC